MTQAPDSIPTDAVEPRMVTLARLARGLLQGELAKRIGIAQGTLSKIEGGQLPATDDVLYRLAEVLDFPVSFFLSPEQIDGPPLPEFYHARKRKSVPTRKLDYVYANVTLRRIHVERLLRSYSELESQFPLMPREEFDNPAKVARTLRAQWEVPQGPVFNMTELTEAAGAIVVTCDFENRQIDGFSRWRVPTLPPLFFMSRDLPPDRWRWTLAHEIGHVVMHTMQDASDVMEHEADSFAEEFLMPEQLIKQQLINLTFPRLAQLKTYWKVSIQALITRAYHLKTITDRQRRYLYMQLNRGGYRLREPQELDPPVEVPHRLNMIVDFHRHDLGYDISELSELLGLNEPELRKNYLPDTTRNLHIVK